MHIAFYMELYVLFLCVYKGVIHNRRITLKTIIVNITFLSSLIIGACNSSVDNPKNTNQKTGNVKKDTLMVEEDLEYMSEKLNPIRTFVKKIDSLKEWSLVIKKDIYLTTEGGEAIFYNWNGELKKVKRLNMERLFKNIPNTI